MGKKIDYFVLTAGITALFYLFFRGAVKSRMLAIALAFLCFAILRRTVKGLIDGISRSGYMKKRKVRKNCSSALMYLACMDADSARQKMHDLLEKIYGKCEAVEIIQRHPSSAVTADDVFQIWKRHKPESKLIICATAQADAICKSMAAELKEPRLALIDASLLTQLIAEHPENMFPLEEKQQRRRLRMRRAFAILFSKQNAPRCIITFFPMLLIYIFSANPFYLASALFLLFAGLISLHRHSRPAKLF